jgi:glucose-1-phosphate thymidylyltransferase
MKGVILSGGSGTRLSPLTVVINKQLLPVFDKPLIFYPLSTLILAGSTEILIVTTPESRASFEKLLGDGTKFGIRIQYQNQLKPEGITHAIMEIESFVNGEPFCLILGDNIFHGVGLGRQLNSQFKDLTPRIFLYQVSNPSDYGVAELSENLRLLDLVEKPKIPKSDLAITGLYFLPGSAPIDARKVLPSNRGEYEIVDLLKVYLEKNLLGYTHIARGTAWLDTGTFSGMHDAASFVRIMEERTGKRVGDPFDSARAMGLIT